MRRVWLVSATVAALILAAIALASVFSRLSVNWTDSSQAPFRVLDTLEIAARNYPVKTASASLLCAPDGNHLLVTLSPLNRHFPKMDNLGSSRGSIHTGIVLDLYGPEGERSPRSFDIDSSVYVRDNVATIVTNLLNAKDEAMLIEWIQRPAPRTISFHVFEIGHGLSADAGLVDRVTEFLHKCHER